jgi:molecular chaperone HtpG
MTPQMEQLLKSMNQEVPKTKRILELNPEHPVLQQLQKRFEQNKEDALIGEFSQLLLGQALLAEGSALPNPGAFSQLVAKLMVNQLR